MVLPYKTNCQWCLQDHERLEHDYFMYNIGTKVRQFSRSEDKWFVMSGKQFTQTCDLWRFDYCVSSY